MKTHKRLLIVLLGIIMSLACVTGLAACSEQDPDIVCTFVMYDDVSTTVSGKSGDSVTFPEAVRDGYAFDGWFVTADFSGDPVGSATFTVDTTYYAKWTKTYAATLDLDGGTLAAGNTVYIRVGANISHAMLDYVPVKGEYQFGGWYTSDGNPLSSSAVMTENGISLKARYKAGYTVNIYTQKLDALSEYEYVANYASGYALIGEAYTLPIAVNGFEIVDADVAALTRVIDADASKNVYVLHFDRETFTLFYNSNYPDGEQQTEYESHLYGTELDVKTDVKFAFEGHRFVGWALTQDADFDDVIKDEKYTLEANTIFYAVWNRGYKDMFGGKDYIYVSPDDKNKAVICRAGVDIPGTYNERIDYYKFEGTFVDENNITFSISAKLKDNGTFYYQIMRSGRYYLYADGKVDETTQIVFQSNDADKLTCYKDGENPRDGTFTVDEDGIYTVVFDDNGETVVFALGIVRNQDGSDTKNVYRIRGEEYSYGTLARRGMYYPVLELDGFGNALYMAPNSAGSEITSTYYNYTIKDEFITLIMTNSQQTLRLIEYGQYGLGYDIYNEDYDVSFWISEKDNPNKLGVDELKLDGCATASVISNEVTVFTGTFTESTSVRGEVILTVTSGSEVRRYRLNPKDSVFNGGPIRVAQPLDENYAEYVYMNTEGSLVGAPYLIVTGEGKGSLYNTVNSAVAKATDGIITYNKNSDSYVFVGETAVNGVKSFEYKTGLIASGKSVYPVYYWLSSSADGEQNTDYTKTLKGSDDSTLTIASASFGIYTDKDGKTVVGNLAPSTSERRIVRLSATTTGGTEYYYFMYDDADAPTTYSVLAQEPVVLRHRKNNSTSSTITLNITGENYSGDKDKLVAIYNDSDKNNPVKIDGYYTVEHMEELGVKFAVNTFYNNNGELRFKFVFISSGNSMYFSKYEITETIAIVTLTEIDDNDANDASKTLALIDEKHSNGKNIVEYKGGSDEQTVRGTLTSAEHSAFNEYDIVVYTFTSLDGLTTFDFTLLSNFFRKSAGTVSYNAAVGNGTLVLDGATHMARYTDANGIKHDGAYLLNNDGMPDGYELTVAMYIDEEMRLIDVTADGTFVIRGLEAASYMVVDNGSPNGRLLMLDGHGNAEIRERVELTGTYNKSSATSYAVTVNDTVYTWTLDTANKTIAITYGSQTVNGIYTANSTNTAFNIVIDSDKYFGKSYICTLDGKTNKITISYYDTVKECGYYIDDNGEYKITDSNTVIYEGKPSVLDIDGTDYNIFVLNTEDISGTYFNDSNLSVIVLDNYGNATYYNSYGYEDSGSYIRIDDDLFYFVNDDASFAAMYTRNGAKVTSNTFNKTFYAADMSSIVLYDFGVASFNNGDGVYFDYQDGKIYIYSHDEKATNAKYGFVKTELQISSDNTVTYNEKTYYQFSGGELTFKDADGNILKFTPTGEATFTVIGEYTHKVGEENKTDKLYVAVDYDDDGNVSPYIAYYKKDYLSGSSAAYDVTVNSDLMLNYTGADGTSDNTNNTFVYDPGTYNYGLSMLDYQYSQILLTYGQTITQLLFNNLYGTMYILGETTGDAENAEIKYTVSGQFNFVTYVDEEGGGVLRAVSFTDGTLTRAGMYNSNYGHMFTSQFTGSDGEKYKVNFFIVPNQYLGVYNYIIFSLTKLGSELYSGNVGSDSYVIYEQEFVYTTGFQIIKDASAEDDSDKYFSKGDKYFPTLSVNGKALCDAGFSEDADKDSNKSKWTFLVYEYDGVRYFDYDYYTYSFDFEYADDEHSSIKANSGTLAVEKTTVKFYTIEGKDSDGVLVNVVDGKVTRVIAMVSGGRLTYTSSCVSLGDGRFVTVVNNDSDKSTKTYLVSFEQKTVGEGDAQEPVTYAVIDSTVKVDVYEGSTENSSAYVCLDKDNNVIAVLGVKYGGDAVLVKESVSDGDKTFTVTTTSGAKYTVTFTEETKDPEGDGEPETVIIATITPRQS